MHKIEKKKRPIYVEVVVIILGTLISAFGLNMLVIPAGLLSGGLTGIGQFINHFIPVNVGILYFILNIPLMILGYIHLGKKFSIYSVFSIILLSISLLFIPIKAIWTDNIMLSAIFGGAIVAFGAAIVLKFGGSQGGMDIVGRIISKYKNITVGKISLIINFFIVVASGFISGSEIALYTIVSMIISMKVFDMTLNQVNRVTLLVITEEGEEVSESINANFRRGSTTWEAVGGYTKKEKSVLFSVITEGELPQFKKLIKEIDKNAFITVISTQNVIGKFNKVW